MATNCELSLARVVDKASMGGALLFVPSHPLQQQQHRLLPFVAVACKHIKLNYCRWAQRLAAVSFAGSQPLYQPCHSPRSQPCAFALSLVVVLVRLVVFVCVAGGQRQQRPWSGGYASKRGFKCALNSSPVACTHTQTHTHTQKKPLGAPLSMLHNFLAAATRFIRHATAYT